MHSFSLSLPSRCCLPIIRQTQFPPATMNATLCTAVQDTASPRLANLYFQVVVSLMLYGFLSLFQTTWSFFYHYHSLPFVLQTSLSVLAHDWFLVINYFLRDSFNYNQVKEASHHESYVSPFACQTQWEKRKLTESYQPCPLTEGSPYPRGPRLNGKFPPASLSYGPSSSLIRVSWRRDPGAS